MWQWSGIESLLVAMCSSNIELSPHINSGKMDCLVSGRKTGSERKNGIKLDLSLTPHAKEIFKGLET